MHELFSTTVNTITFDPEIRVSGLGRSRYPFIFERGQGGGGRQRIPRPGLDDWANQHFTPWEGVLPSELREYSRVINGKLYVLQAGINWYHQRYPSEMRSERGSER